MAMHGEVRRCGNQIHQQGRRSDLIVVLVAIGIVMEYRLLGISMIAFLWTRCSCILELYRDSPEITEMRLSASSGRL